MWSKVPRPGGKGLRCTIHVQRGVDMERCDRPARRYGQEVRAFWDADRIQDLGCIDCCKEHARKLQSQGFILTIVDRRRTANP